MKKPEHIIRLTAAAAAAVLLYSCGAADMNERAPAEVNSYEASEVAAADSTIAIAYQEEGGLFSDSLSEEQKEVLGKRAMQKLEDLYGYKAIMSGHFDSIVHDQAKTLMADLFDGKADADSIAAHTFPIEVRDIVVSKGAEAVNDSLYRGELTFQTKIPGESRRERINFVIKKVNKSFGTEQRRVWETYLEH